MDIYNTLTITEKVTFLKIEQLGTKILTMNLEQVASHCNVSTATIKRSLNKQGYKNLKAYKSSINVPQEHSNLELNSFEQHLCQLTTGYDHKLIHTSSMMIHDSDFIYIVAFGLSTSIAMEMSIQLRKTGKRVVYINDSDALNQITSTTLKKSDLFIYISYSGEDMDMTNFATLVRNNTRQILITTNQDCSLAPFCNQILTSNTINVYDPFNSRIPINIITYKLITCYYDMFSS